MLLANPPLLSVLFPPRTRAGNMFFFPWSAPLVMRCAVVFGLQYELLFFPFSLLRFAVDCRLIFPRSPLPVRFPFVGACHEPFV